MAKRRRKSNKPNLPADVLARARKNAGVEEPEATEADASSTENGDSDETASVTERAARRRKLSTVQLERSRKRGEMSNELIESALNNPTKVVTEEELREDYQHVLFDLRNMGILAAILIMVMMGLAFTLPTF